MLFLCHNVLLSQSHNGMQIFTCLASYSDDVMNRCPLLEKCGNEWLLCWGSVCCKTPLQQFVFDRATDDFHFFADLWVGRSPSSLFHVFSSRLPAATALSSSCSVGAFAAALPLPSAHSESVAGLFPVAASTLLDTSSSPMLPSLYCLPLLSAWRKICRVAAASQYKVSKMAWLKINSLL